MVFITQIQYLQPIDLTIAITNGNILRACECIESGVSPHHFDLLYDPFVLAVLCGDTFMVEWLLMTGADASCHSSISLIFAKTEPMIRLLLKYGADVNIAFEHYSYLLTRRTMPYILMYKLRSKTLLEQNIECFDKIDDNVLRAHDINVSAGLKRMSCNNDEYVKSKRMRVK